MNRLYIHKETLTATPKEVCKANLNRVRLLILNNENVLTGTTPEIVEDSSQLYGEGLPLAPQETFKDGDADRPANYPVWMLCTTGETSELRIMEVLRDA